MNATRTTPAADQNGGGASETLTIFQIFAAVKREVRAVGKDQRNQQQNFNFRGVDAVVNAAAPALDKHGVITLPVLEEIEYTTVEVGQKRTPMAHVRVKVTYRFHGPAGDHLDALVPGEAMDSGDKGTAKAMSVAYRIALIQALNLPTSDEDPDGKTYERSSRDSFENSRPAPPRHADRMPSVPADDPWYGATPDANAADASETPPAPAAAKADRPRVTRPEAAESDQVWLDLMHQEIEQIKTRADGNKAWAHIAKAYNEGSCTAADRKALEGLTGGKISEVIEQEPAKGTAA